MKYKKWKVIVFSVVLIIFSGVIYDFFWKNYSTTTVDKMLKVEGINPNGILKKYEFKNTTDIFSIDKNSLFLISLKKTSDNGKTNYKRRLIFEQEDAFLNVGKNTFIDEIKFQVTSLTKIPSILNHNQGRTVLFGVTLDKNVYDLKIDNQKVTDVFEVNKSDEVYYIWYFNDIELQNNVDVMKITF